MEKINLESLVATLVNTRDFCGNERQAAKDWFADEGIAFDKGVYRAASILAGVLWRQSQRDAGMDV